MRRRGLASKVRHRVVVYPPSGDPIEGVLMDETRDGLMLRVASVSGQQLVGDVFIPSASIQWVQIPPVEVLR